MLHRTYEQVKDSMLLAAGQDVMGRGLVEDFDQHAVVFDLRTSDEGSHFVTRRTIPEERVSEAGFMVFLPDAGEVVAPDDQSTTYLDNYQVGELDRITLCAPEADSTELWFGLKALMEWHKLRRQPGFNRLVDDFSEGVQLLRDHGAGSIAVNNLRRESFKARQAYVLETNQLINALAYRVLKQRVLKHDFRLDIPKDITVSQAMRYVTAQFAEAIANVLPEALSPRESRTRIHIVFAAVHGAVAEQKIQFTDPSVC